MEKLWKKLGEDFGQDQSSYDKGLFLIEISLKLQCICGKKTNREFPQWTNLGVLRQRLISRNLQRKFCQHSPLSYFPLLWNCRTTIEIEMRHCGCEYYRNRTNIGLLRIKKYKGSRSIVLKKLATRLPKYLVPIFATIIIKGTFTEFWNLVNLLQSSKKEIKHLLIATDLSVFFV